MNAYNLMVCRFVPVKLQRPWQLPAEERVRVARASQSIDPDVAAKSSYLGAHHICGPSKFYDLQLEESPPSPLTVYSFSY